MTMKPECTPVIVGVGQINDRPDDPASGLDSVQLMIAALRLADEDAGGGWLEAIDSLAIVDQISFRHLNPATDSVANAIGAAPSLRYQTPSASGDSPVLLLNEAANRIGKGEISVAAVAGGEALRTSAHRAAAAAKTNVSAQNAVRATSTRKTPGYRQTYGLSAPVDVYPLYENAGRASYGQSLEEAQAETGRIWSQFSEVAESNRHAWLKKRVAADQIVEPSASNRPIAHPYTKFMVANSSVNQGAAFLVCSLAEAMRRGVSRERLIYVGYGAAAHEADDFLARATYERSSSMEVSLSKAMELNQLKTSDLDYVELYSCFPCVPKMARRILDWPVEKPASVFGGLTFGGGPIGNYMSHAIASMVEKLRGSNQERAMRGLLFANGGFATHNHTIALSSQPWKNVEFPQSFDVQEEADHLRGPVPELDKSYTGHATIESYTVAYARDGSIGPGTIVARTPEGSRTLAMVPASDRNTISLLTDGIAEPVGSTGNVVAGDDGIMIWTGA